VTNVSISLRLTAWFSAVFLAGFVLFGIVMWLQLATSLEQGRKRTLSRRASRLGDLVRDYRGARSEVLAARYAEFADATPEGNLIQLYAEDGKRLFPGTQTTSVFPWPPLRPSGEQYDRVSNDDRYFLVLTRHTVIGGERYVVRVAGQLEDNRLLLAMFTRGLVAATPALLLASALFGYLLSRRALRPVDRLTLALRSISIGNLPERLPVQATGDELQRLATTCNEMLARVEGAVGRINRFTADASHELRSPISFIRTVAEYGLRNPQLDSESRQGFEEILVEAEEASRLLEDMLCLARADAGQAEVHFEPVNLSEVLEEVCEKARPIAQKKQQRLTLSQDVSHHLMVQGDRSALRRLIWTLLDNAMKYTPERGRVEIQAEGMSSAVRLTVRDSGVGIAANVLPRVFDRFFRADASRSQTEGSGLGLAIAKWIADCHRATLTVDSVPGQGSIFRVDFPAAT
jgi:heavy metal sensor kinase